jgi:hypothetical protein
MSFETNGLQLALNYLIVAGLVNIEQSVPLINLQQ